MHTQTKYYAALLMVLMALAGCEPVYYKPTKVNTPLLSEAGQVEFCAATGNAQFAFSPVKNLGIIGGHSGFTFDAQEDFGRERVNFYEVGVGYYNHIDTPHRGKTSGWIYDIYGGYGLGRINVANNSKSSFPSMNVSRMFIQPGIGIRTRVIEFSFNWRFCDVRYNNFNLPGSSKTPKEDQDYIFSEPAVTFRVGYKPIKLEIQYVNSNPLSSTGWNRSSGALNVGICAIIGGYK